MFWKLSAPVLLTFIAGSIVLFNFFVKMPLAESLAGEMLRWDIIVKAFATALGAANLLRIHSRKVQGKDQRTKLLSATLLISMAIYTAIGILKGHQSDLYQFYFRNLFTPLSATMFSLNAFFIASAAFRAFRVRSAQAAVLLVTAFIVMLGNTGIGEAIGKFVPSSKDWVMAVINTAGARGILIGSSLGAIAISIRVLTGLERGHLGGVE
ncbi:MAG: hypothetical protein AB1445_10805 [Bacillota bacterium]